ncbi:MAG: hypothetical protein ACLUOI_21970 [Eisenbergiella sp.]
MAKTELAVAELIWNIIARKREMWGRWIFPAETGLSFGDTFPEREAGQQP